MTKTRQQKMKLLYKTPFRKQRNKKPLKNLIKKNKMKINLKSIKTKMYHIQ